MHFISVYYNSAKTAREDIIGKNLHKIEIDCYNLFGEEVVKFLKKR